MKTKIIKRYYSVCILFLIFAFGMSVKSQNVEITLTDVRSTKGQIVVSAFTDNQSFINNKMFMMKNFAKTNMSNGKMTVKFDIEPGTYGFVILDDENSNNEMEYNFLGIPKEGFGFSNYIHSGFKRPNFDDFKIKINKNQNVRITIKTTYM